MGGLNGVGTVEEAEKAKKSMGTSVSLVYDIQLRCDALEAVLELLCSKLNDQWLLVREWEVGKRRGF